MQDFAAQNSDTETERLVMEYQDRAVSRDPEAQLLLGSCYRRGKGVEQDTAQALHWVRCAAGQGYAPAQLYLAECCSEGFGTARDTAQAAAWIQKAAEQGYAQGQSVLGYCYLEGFGVEQDGEQAVAWLQKAAAQGDSRAQFGLAMCCFDGIGVEQDCAKGIMYCKQAAEQEYVKAILQLGICYMYGNGVVKNLRTAEEYLCRAIKAGDEQGWEDADEQAMAHRLLAQTCYARYVRDNLSLHALELINFIPFINIATISFAASAGEKTKLKKFLKTEEGKFMLEHLQTAADFGDNTAISMLKKCR